MLHKSFWIDGIGRPSFPSLKGSVVADVAVVGGGITGLVTAFMLKEAGLKVVLVEAGSIGGGVTGHTTAKVTYAHGLVYQSLISYLGVRNARLYADSNAMALDWIASLSRRFDCDFHRSDSYIYVGDNFGRLESELSAVRMLGLPAVLVDDPPLRLIGKGALRYANQGRFHPMKFLIGISSLIGKGVIFENSRAKAIEEGVVKTENGEVKAKKIIVATHYPVFDDNNYFLKLFPWRSYVLAMKLKEPFPDCLFYRDDYPFHSFRTYNDLVIFGGEDHRTGQVSDTSERYRRLLDFARSNFSVKSVEYRWSTQDNLTPDFVPFVGSKGKGIFVASGFQGWGMTNSVVAAFVLSGSVVGKKSKWAGIYDVSRGMSFRAFPNMIRENAGGLGHFVKSRFVKGRKCTHMGCRLTWNDAENSWDCPCHGSRFSADGKVLHSPAIEPLKEKD